MKSKEKILEQFHNHYKYSKGGLPELCRYLYGRGTSQRAQEVSFNMVKPYVNAFVGFFIQNRKKAMFHAKTTEEQVREVKTDYINGYYDYIRENCNADQVETKQDFDLAIGGVGVTDTAISLKDGTPTRLPGGEIIKERVDPLECGWDPQATGPNLMDGKWAWRAKNYDVKEAVDLLDAKEEDFEAVNQSEYIHDYKYNPYGGIQDKIGFEYAAPDRKQLRVYFYQWFEIETFYRIENPLLQINDPMLGRMLFLALGQVDQEEEDETFAFDPTAQILTITKDVKSTVKEIFEAFGLPFKPVKGKRKVFYTAILSGDKVFQSFKSVSQQAFSLQFKIGDRDEKNNIYTGIVSSMKQPQRYYNKALTEFMFIIASNSKGGVIARKGAIGNIQEFEAKYARSSSVVEVNDLDGVRPKATPQMNTGYEAIMGLSGDAFEKVTGINETFFGVSASGNETALLQRQRVKQATTLLAPYVDAVDLYMKEQARLMLSFMRLLAEANEGDLFNVKDDEGNIIFESVSRRYLADEYAITISEAPETDAQKDYYANVLIKLGDSLQTVGQVDRANQIFAIAIKQLPLLEKDKQEVITALQGDTPIDPRLVQQLQNQVQQLLSQKSQIEDAKNISDIQKTTVETRSALRDIQSKDLDDGEKMEDIEKKSIENDLMAMKPIQEVNVTI